jgi:redox-sensitive bicupin YhaK (pirin superfamily)
MEAGIDVSGPVDAKDVPDAAEAQDATPTPVVAVSNSRLARVGSLPVRRALPNRGRRTVGAWCFADHFGPVKADEEHRPDIGPHPHMGLQTVTWLLEGELVHRDSLGSEQVIRPGQLNLMTAGHGVAHAEEATSGYRGGLHGIQLWVAQPSATRHGPPAFEHHAELPRVELDNCDATVLVGELDGSQSSARRDTEHVGLDLEIRGATTVPVEPAFEYALVVTEGAVVVEGQTFTPGHLVAGRDELVLGTVVASRMLLLGGSPFQEPLLMWWNFVARTRDEVEAGYEDWANDSGRFGRVASLLPRIEANRPFWMR